MIQSVVFDAIGQIFLVVNGQILKQLSWHLVTLCKDKFGQWLWPSWYSGRFRHQRSVVRIQSLTLLLTIKKSSLTGSILFQISYEGAPCLHRLVFWGNFITRSYICTKLDLLRVFLLVIVGYHLGNLFYILPWRYFPILTYWYTYCIRWP